MSLLLDALKKAADENKKDAPSGEINKNEEISTDQIENEDLDLELELTEQEEVPEFPQVNQEIIRPDEETSGINEDRDENYQQTDSETSPESEPGSEIELVDDNLKVTQDVVIKEEYKDDVESSSLSSEFKQAKHDAPDIEQVSVEKLEQSKADSEARSRSQRENVVETERKHNQHKEALSALINKNNTFSNRRRRVVSLAVISFILFLLMAASFYAYMMLEKVDNRRINPGLTDNEFVNNSESLEVKVEEPSQNNSNIEKPVARVSKNELALVGKQAAVTNVHAKKQVTKKPIQIRKKTLEDPIGVLLARAYAAFNKSDYQTAESVYNKVISRDKNNHDALLGLAAIAVKQNRNDVAKRIYSKLLVLDPKDSFAKAGLSALINQNNSYLNESQLKIMLREQPDAGHLYFALGNILLNQNRYAEAQTAFFSAWSTNKSNTDYAFNLAVSLDHLGKTENALEFYELTIKLFKKTGGNVSVDKINQRMQLIKGNNNG